MQAVLLIAALSVGQEFQVGPTFVVKQPDRRAFTYADAFHAAQRANKPLVIFIDCKSPKFGTGRAAPWYEWVEVSAGEWEGMGQTQERGVIIAVGNTVFKRLPPTATVSEISLWVSRALAPLQPRRAVRSPTQIQWSGGVTAAQC